MNPQAIYCLWVKVSSRCRWRVGVLCVAVRLWQSLVVRERFPRGGKGGANGACEQPRRLSGQVRRSVKRPACDRLCQTYHSDCRPLLRAAARWKFHPGPCSPTTTTLSASSAPPSSPPPPRPTSPAFCFRLPSGAQRSPPGLQVRGCWLVQWLLIWPVCWMENNYCG